MIITSTDYTGFDTLMNRAIEAVLTSTEHVKVVVRGTGDDVEFSIVDPINEVVVITKLGEEPVYHVLRGFDRDDLETFISVLLTGWTKWKVRKSSVVTKCRACGLLMIRSTDGGNDVCESCSTVSMEV